MDINVDDALLAEWIDMSLAVEEVVVDDTPEIQDRPQSSLLLVLLFLLLAQLLVVLKCPQLRNH